MEKDLEGLVSRLKVAAGDNLKSVVLYGSAAAGEFHPKYSDLNVLCILERLGAQELQKLGEATRWWTRKGHPAPFLFTLEELTRSAGVFAIELWDIKASHRVLFGEDVFSALNVPMKLHRVQVERELRSNLVKLRQHYLLASRDSKSLLGLVTTSISAFLTLFRHALIVLGEEPPRQKREVVDRLAAVLGFDAAPFHAVLGVREGKRRARDVDAAATFSELLSGMTRAVEEVDRRLKTAGGA